MRRTLLALGLTAAVAGALATPAGAAAATTPAYSYAVLQAPNDVPSGRAADHSAYENAVEPSIGADWASGTTAYIADLGTYFVRFDDATRPATATWTPHDAPTSATTLDPILFTDNYRDGTGTLHSRTFVSELAGTTSLASRTDDGGLTYTPVAQLPTQGVDHQTIGAGPFSGGVPVGALSSRAEYYCSQDIAGAFCQVSLDGGQTFGAQNAPYTASDGATVGCQGLHGHVRVGPDGTVFLPNKNCGTSAGSLPGAAGNLQGLAINTGNNVTPWTVETVPGSVNGITDPSVSADSAGKAYFGFGQGYAATNGTAGHPMVSTRTKAGSWSQPFDIGALTSPPIVQTVFPDVVAGSDGRAAFSFLGSTTPTAADGKTGVDQGFAGSWQEYIARTTDGGASWTLTQLTTDAQYPVQKGCVQLGGTCTHRNLYDFQDITADQLGRVQVGFAKGCVLEAGGTVKGCRDGSSATGDTSSDNTNVGQIARQDCGPSLYAAQDAALQAVCAAAVTTDGGPTPVVPEAQLVPLLLLAGVGVVGAVAWRRRSTA